MGECIINRGAPIGIDDYIVSSEWGYYGDNQDEWHLIKYNSGNAICWSSKVANVAIDSAHGSMYRSPGIIGPTFPSGVFIAAPVCCNITANCETNSIVMLSVDTPATTTDTPVVYMMRGTTKAATNYRINYLAIGRWK